MRRESEELREKQKLVQLQQDEHAKADTLVLSNEQQFTASGEFMLASMKDEVPTLSSLRKQDTCKQHTLATDLCEVCWSPV